MLQVAPRRALYSILAFAACVLLAPPSLASVECFAGDETCDVIDEPEISLGWAPPEAMEAAVDHYVVEIAWDGASFQVGPDWSRIDPSQLSVTVPRSLGRAFKIRVRSCSTNGSCSDPSQPSYSISFPAGSGVNVPVEAIRDPNRIGMGDFDGDGLVDVIKRDGSADMGVIEFGSGGNSAGLLLPPNQDLSLVGRGDFDADGREDLLFRDEVTGHHSIWLMNDAAAPVAQDLYDTSVPWDTRWRITQIGDFNGDGYSDLLWLFDAKDYWIGYMGPDLVPTMARGPFWDGLSAFGSIVQTADFDGNGLDDYLYRHDKTGGHMMFLSQEDGSVSGSFYSSLGDPGWHITLVGDFDGNGLPDTFWEHNDFRVKYVFFSKLSGTGQGLLPARGKMLRNWRARAAGVGDFDGDAREDVLLEDGSRILGFEISNR